MNDYYGNEQGNQPPSSRQQQSGFDPNRSPSNQQLSASEIMNMTMTPQEKQVLGECQTQATIRGVSLGVLATGACYYLMNNGTLKKNRLILGLSSFSGFLLGTMSYRTTCMQKLMALPNSNFKTRILQAQGLQQNREYQSRDGESQAWFDERNPNNLKLQSNDFSPMGHAIDIEPYQSPDYDSSSRGPINNDSDAGFKLNPSLPNNNSPYVNYDDLRRKNRIDYENKAIPRSSPYQQPQQHRQQQPTDQIPPSYDGGVFDPPPRPNDYWR